MQFHVLLILYLVITVINAAILCPSFVQSDTIPLQYSNAVFTPDCSSGDASICIAADAGLPQETVQGWKYVNTGDNLDGRGNKINWYFQASWYLAPTPDILLPSPSDITPSLTVGCLNELSFTVKGKIDALFIRIYTKTKGNDNDLTSWYRSRLLISSTELNTNNIEFNTFTTITASQLNDAINTAYSLPLTDNTDNTDNSLSNSAASNLQEIFDNEEILAIALSTNSGKQGDGTYSVRPGENDFIISDFTVQYDEGCTCPIKRILDLTGIPFQDIGANCNVDIGSCDDCTCKQQCIHQDGVDGGFDIRKDIISSDDCCAICNQINDAVDSLLSGGAIHNISPALLQKCMAYTYLTAWDKSDCCQQYEAGDCILFGSKLNQCTATKYGISGSINDGICDIESSVGDCCDGIDCVDGICDEPISGPATVPSGGGKDLSNSDYTENDDDEEIAVGSVHNDDDDGKQVFFEDNNNMDNNGDINSEHQSGKNLVIKLGTTSLINIWAIALMIAVITGLAFWYFVIKTDEKEITHPKDVETGFDITKITPVGQEWSSDEYID